MQIAKKIPRTLKKKKEEVGLIASSREKKID